ncbi:MAG TPA: HAMP domain-containing sensor histidine kinase [Acidimicrobiia bacterium]|nr:HAMP domain-containing sensor histidine kinase [Acidimicrobiia bacterium]
MRRRILISLVGLTALAVLVFGIPLGYAAQRLYHDEEIFKLQREAAEAAQHVPENFGTGTDPVELPPEDGISYTLYDEAGHRVTGRGPAVADATVRAALRGDVADATSSSTLVAAVPVTRQKGSIGAIRAGAPASLVTDRSHRAWLVMAALGAAAVGVSALIGLWQSRRLTRPVDRLAQSATRLGQGDFTVRTEPAGVPELDAVARALDTTATRLDTMLARERAFSSDASHQLRNPLAALRMELEMARLDSGIDRASLIADALVEVSRLERTIDDLLELARDTHEERAALRIDRVVDELDQRWHGSLAAEGRPFRTIIEPDAPGVHASEAAVRQVVDVLVDNAATHGAGTVTLRARAAGTGLAIEVSDEGPGIREGEVDRIFDRRRADDERHGIGLALARSLAEAEGGRLVLQRERPAPTFAIVLPADGESAAAG